MGNPRGRSFRRAAAALATCTLASATATSPAVAGARGPARPATRATVAAGDVVTLRPLTTSADRRIVDDQGRDVLLRGANVNSLGEYWQGVPSIPTTIPLTEADWSEMAAHGFSVIRLLISWSKVEPTRGVFDQGYLDQVDGYVRAAAAHGIYSVIDMHQDAYTATISTADPSTCPAGTHPAKGWDGAPAWATLTDGLSTCVTGDRNSSPAVTRAWNNFYDDVDGIRGEFAAAWGAVAARFAGRPEVAGYDLLNEPEVSRPSADLQGPYDDLLRTVGLAIRSAEAGAPFAHLLIAEPAIPAADPSRGLVIPDVGAIGLGTKGIVASVHNYAESITGPGLDFTIEGLNDVIMSLTASLGSGHVDRRVRLLGHLTRHARQGRPVRRGRGRQPDRRRLVAVAPVVRRPAQRLLAGRQRRRSHRRGGPPQHGCLSGQHRGGTDGRVPPRAGPRLPVGHTRPAHVAAQRSRHRPARRARLSECDRRRPPARGVDPDRR